MSNRRAGLPRPLAAFACLAAASWISGAALADPSPVVTAPGGGVQQSSQPMTVLWANIVQNSQVMITLIAHGPNWTQAAVGLANHVANSGHYTVPAATLRPLCTSLPASLQPATSQPVPVGQMTMVVAVRSYNNYHGHDYAESAPFRLKCPFDPHIPSGQVTATSGGIAHQAPLFGGALTVEKRIVNNATVPPPQTAFVVAIDCAPNGPHTSVTLTAANAYRQTVSSIEADRSCTITERPPSVPPELAQRGCSWTTTYPDDQRALIADGATATLQIVNTWTCKPGAIQPAGPDGSKPLKSEEPARGRRKRGE